MASAYIATSYLLLKPFIKIRKLIIVCSNFSHKDKNISIHSQTKYQSRNEQLIRLRSVDKNALFLKNTQLELYTVLDKSNHL